MRVPASRNRTGFTLLEAVIAIAFMGTLFGTVGVMTDSARRAFSTSTRTEELHMKARRALGRVSEELRSAGAATLIPNPDSDFGSDAMSFSNPADLDGANIVWGSISRVAFEYDPGDPDDGLDNDGDGLVDEGQLVLTRNVGEGNEQRFIICRGLSELREGEVLNGDDDDGNGVADEAGFNIHRTGNELELRLTLERLEGGVIVQRTVETSLRLRN